MKRSKIGAVLVGVLLAATIGYAQDVGAAADSSFLSFQLSYEHLSRDFTLAGVRQDVGRDMFTARIGFRPGRAFMLYGFVGSSDFPTTLSPDATPVYFGGGLKYALLGEVDVEETSGSHIKVKGGVGVGFQVSRLQSSARDLYDEFGLTEVQASLDFGIRAFAFAGYLGFKFNGLSGEFRLPSGSAVEVEGKGLFSLVLGFNAHVHRLLAFVSEFSFFTESSWSLGIRLDLEKR